MDRPCFKNMYNSLFNFIFIFEIVMFMSKSIEYIICYFECVLYERVICGRSCHEDVMIYSRCSTYSNDVAIARENAPNRNQAIEGDKRCVVYALILQK
jgi:hypothetical protein